MALDGFIHLLLIERVEDRRRMLEVNIHQRRLRDATNAFELPSGTFVKLFRIDKLLAFDLIEKLSPHMNEGVRITAVPKHIKILSVLNFFGQGSYQRGIGHGYSFCLSQPVISRSITEVTNVIVQHLLQDEVKFPVTNEEKIKIKKGFKNIDQRFKSCIGVVDGTYIRIIAPPADHPIHPSRVYYCRKNYYAVNTMIICDSNKKIIAINARFPGSVHDAAIWMTSNIKRNMQNNFIATSAPDYLIGDNGYPLEPWLLVPYGEADNNSPEARFNEALSKVRVSIEHVNGMLKSRFRCLHGHRALNYDPVKAAKIIYSCAVLHNLCRNRNVELPEDNPHEEEPPRANNDRNLENHLGDMENEGRRRRNELLQHNIF